MARDDAFTTVRSLGGLLPTDLLQRVADLDPDLAGMSATAYGLGSGERLRDVIARSWSRLTGVWEGLQVELDRLPESDRATSLTRERWLLVLLQELGFGRVATATAAQISGRSYAISHGWGAVPLHLLGWRLDLDRAAEGVAGAARMSPHGLAQEFLNRSDDHLWALVSNGRRLRVLRDTASLSRQSFVEFDLEAMFEGEVYADFVLLWLTCHATRFEADRPELCILEQWVTTAHRDGTRALDRLRDGVEQALVTLGTGLLAHPANAQLRSRLQAGELTPTEYYRQLLRVVYRLLFLFVSEDRGLLLQPGEEHADARRTYQRWYSTRALRDLARRQAGGRHDDRWELLTRVFRLIGSEDGCSDLALPPMGSGLWQSNLTPDVVGEQGHGTRLRNGELLDAVRHLAWTEDQRVVRAVDYRNLGAEELGSVYEALLELHPVVSVSTRRFQLSSGAGNERKTTGSYYTPTSLIEQLLSTALDPLLDRAERAGDPEVALLNFSVCDPACGSGHFLVAAAHRIAGRLASVRADGDQPSPEQTQDALRDVVSRCVYGVDINPMAIELAKVNLWLEAQVPGKPLTFLDHHFKVGNALLGATPALVARGVPDGAFKPIEGDEKKVVSAMRKANKQLRESGQQQLSLAAEDAPTYEVLAGQAAEVTELRDDTVAAQQAKQEAYQRLDGSEALRRARLVADTWCATFTASKAMDAQGAGQWPHELFYELRDGDPPATSKAYATVGAEVARYGFFHWHLEFPHLFTPEEHPATDDPTGWGGGFSLMLGNPPWERVKLQEQEWWASRDPEVAEAPNAAARKRMIKQVAEDNPDLHTEFLDAKREAEGWSHFLRDSDRYPLAGVGDVNTYQVFAELFRHAMSETGRAGFIVPTGIATDHTTRHYFADLVATKTLASLFDFENRAKLFPEVDSRMKFALLTLSGENAPVDAAEFAFFAHATTDLRDPERRFTLTPEDIELINPNTRTAPVFRTRRDAEICAKIYRNVPVLIREGRDGQPDRNPWGAFYGRFIHYGDHSQQLRSAPGDDLVPVLEAKMIHQFDHRYASMVGSSTHEASASDKHRPDFDVEPRYWVEESFFKELLQKYGEYTESYFLAWRDVARATDARTSIAAAIPLRPTSVNLPVLGFLRGDGRALLAILNSFAFDYFARQFVGGMHLNFGVLKQLPVPDPSVLENVPFLPDRHLLAKVSELSNTSHDLTMDRLAPGSAPAVFPWREARRQTIRNEIDASVFHLYGMSRDEVNYVMETFPIIKRKDEKEHGEYRTKRLILEIYDDMAEAIRTGEPYQTLLDPPPADPSLQVSV